MHISLKCLRNFLVSNICALLPLMWTAMGWMPDQVKVYMRGEENENAVALYCDKQLLWGENYGRWAEGWIWRFYLRDGMRWRDLEFRLPPGKVPEDIKSIDYQKWKFLIMKADGAGLVPVGAGDGWQFDELRFEHFGFASHSVAWGIALTELLLLSLSYLFARRHREEAWNTLFGPVVLTALTLSFLMRVALPVQSYLVNQSAYPFSPGVLTTFVVLRFAWMFAVTVVSLGLLSRCFGRWVLGGVLSFAVCVYLETGLLSTGLPELNGDWWPFRNRTRALWDTVAWSSVFILSAVLHPIVKHKYPFVAFCLLVMSLASLFDVKCEGKANLSKLIVHDFSPIETVVRSVTYSNKRNVLVFIIDSLEREQAHAIMNDPDGGAELRRKFRGFTEYLDNVGAWNTSLPAVANIFTGLNPSESIGVADYFAAPYSRDSLLVDYLDAGFAVFIDTKALGYGYTNHRKVDISQSPHENVSSSRVDGDLKWTLEEVVRFRSCPFAVKYTMASLTGFRVPMQSDWGDERILFPVLAKGSVDGERGSFIFCHTRGVHWPVEINRRGERLMHPNNTSQGCEEAGIWVLGQLGLLFDQLRDRGVYDNSMILVLADHGNHDWSGKVSCEGLPGNGRPFLWVKAPGSTHDFIADNAPTHHGRIANLLKKACRADLTEEEIQDILTAPHREYRMAADFGGEINVWVVERDGTCTTRTETIATSALIPLQIGLCYRFDHKHIAQDGAGIEFVRCGFWPCPVWSCPNPLEMRFRVPDPKRRYAAHVSLKMTEDRNHPEVSTKGFLRLGQKGSKCGFVEVQNLYRQHVILHGLCPDRMGEVVLFGERMDGLNANIFAMDLLLEEE